MHIIKSVYIKKFRAFENLTISLDSNVVAIAGQNGTMKTTLLGMLAQPFSLAQKSHKLFNAKTIDGSSFGSDLRDKFKFSPQFDPIGEHEWTLEVSPDIYEKEIFTCISIDRKSGKKAYDIRFWSNDKSKQAGSGYIQCPTIYLSLKRLLPLGEISSIEEDIISLSTEEESFYKEWHNRILISTENLSSVHHLAGKDKSSLGAGTANTDAITISAGQDNIGKIILAVLSFKRLKKKYPDAYKGGLIFIDELETTLYPAAQIKLLEFMFKEASKSQLQFFFTTHSKTILEFLKTGKYHKETSLVYLKKSNNKIDFFQDLSWSQIDDHLTLGLLGNNIYMPQHKIKVYAEDCITFAFLQKLLPKCIRNIIDLQKTISLSSAHYKMLLERNVTEFTNSIIILDGDMKRGADKLPARFIDKFKNIVFLPGEFFPEKLIFNEFWNLQENDSFWDTLPGGYDRQRCFIDVPHKLTEKIQIKDWFYKQQNYVGKNCIKFISYYLKHHPDDVAEFYNSFILAYNSVAIRTGFQEIYP